MHGKFRPYPEAVRLLLLVYLFLVAAHTAHAVTSPQNAYGLSVDYTGGAAAGTLRVKLRDAILGGKLAGIRIVAHEIRADGLAYWAGEETSDSNGLAVFSLKQLGSGGRYYLKAFVWHDQPVYTQTLTAAGTIAWKTGRVRVRVKNATLAVPAPLAGYEVRLRRTDGSWGRRLTTDGQGVLRLDPPGLDKGIPYELTAISPLGGDRETSTVINAAGTYTFKVGNRPLVVTLRRADSNSVLAGKKVIVQERLADGTRVWAAAGRTDNAGRVVFELDSLGRGGRFVLRTNPFAVRMLDSELITKTGGYTFRVGNTPVTLINDVSGKRLVDKKLVAFTVVADKQLAWYSAGQTDASGTVFFDFPEVSTGTVFGVRADDPFGNGERFFSTLIREQGPLQLRVRKGASERLDRVDPVVSISSPVPGKAAAAGGFVLQGRASDDREIDRVVIEIRSGGKQQEADAWYNPTNDRWFFNVSANMLVTGSRAIITATVVDTSNNR
ncbi:MAG: Ig-like domain-containing protein, partial [Pseudomonadota bacterium]|nr:Ig-like domain-containing protein [Pseudomonadota bacterium]